MAQNPFNSEDSILAWERESSRGVAPSTAAPWQEFGRITEWSDLGPRQVITRDHVAGAGQQPHEIQAEGTHYGGTIGPFQVRDPKLLGFVFSKESTRAQIGATAFYRHTLVPTDLGKLDSMAIGMRDRTLDGTALHESLIYLESVMPKLAVRGEAVNDDGSGGRLLAACDLMPHDHTTTNATAVTCTPSSTLPYRFSHGKISIAGEQVFRVKDFELTVDRRAKYAYYWQDTGADKPYEAPPEGCLGTLSMNLVADGEKITVGGTDYSIRELLRSRIKFDSILKFTRTADQDEFQFNLTDVMLEDAVGMRRGGKVMIRCNAPIRSLNMQYVDNSNAAYFST